MILLHLDPEQEVFDPDSVQNNEIMNIKVNTKYMKFNFKTLLQYAFFSA